MSDKPFYVLVTGGRDYKDRRSVGDALHAVLMAIPTGRRMVLVHGGALGADTLADDWAHHWKQACLKVPAEWHRFTEQAGAKRNQQMLDWLAIDLVVAFPGGAGTRDMVARAEKAKIQTIHAGDHGL